MSEFNTRRIPPANNLVESGMTPGIDAHDRFIEEIMLHDFEEAEARWNSQPALAKSLSELCDWIESVRVSLGSIPDGGFFIREPKSVLQHLGPSNRKEIQARINEARLILQRAEWVDR